MIRCEQCGFQNSYHANFCGGCALALTEPFQRPKDSIAYESIIPQEIRGNILRSRALVEGTNRHATVMFADIRASLSFFRNQDNLDTEKVCEIFDIVLEIMRASIHKYEGFVAQTMGDGLMAWFGAPVALEDHASRACFAALDMQARIKSQSHWPVDDIDLIPKIRVGLNSGSVLIATISNDLNMDYRAIGETTHMAQRMESLAQAGTTRLTKETRNLARGYIDATSMGLCNIKGIHDEIETFELSGRTSLTRFQALSSTVLSPFIGRKSELQQLDDFLKSAIGGERLAIALSGDAGIGKSRLSFEFLKRPLVKCCSILQLEGLDDDKAPFSALRRLFQAKLGITRLDAPELIKENLAQFLTMDQRLVEYQSALETLLNMRTRNEKWIGLDPSQRRRQIFAAFQMVLSSMSNNRSLILICEDIQWFDSESLAFIEQFIAWEQAEGVLVLATKRSEWTASEPCPKFHHECRLSQLSSTNTDELLSKLIGQDQSSSDIREKIAKQTCGSPLFIEETFRHMTESGALIGDPGNYQPAYPAVAIKVPPSVESVITARIDRLAPDLKELLTHAAIIGDEITAELLGSFLVIRELLKSGLSEDEITKRMVISREKIIEEELLGRLNRIVDLEMLILQSQSSRQIYKFRHAYIRDVLYASLVSKARVKYHKNLVKAYEIIYGRAIKGKADQLAHHAFEGRLWLKSAQYQLEASKRAIERSANEYAWSAISKGIRSLKNLNDDKLATIQLGIDLRLAGQGALLPIGAFDRISILVREAEELATSISDQDRLGAVYSQLAMLYWCESNHELAQQASERALAISKQEKDTGLEIRANYNLGMINHSYGKFTDAISMFTKLLGYIPEADRKRQYGWVGNPSVFCMTFMASAMSFIGDFKEALNCFGKGLELADEVSHPYSQTMLREELGFCHLLMGNPDQAISVFEQAQLICDEFDVLTMKAPLAARMGDALCEVGRVDEAKRLIDQAFEKKIYLTAGRYGLNYLMLAKANTETRLGNLTEAVKVGKELELMTRRSKEFAHNTLALVALGEAYAPLPATQAEAEAAFCQAKSQASKLGMRPIIAKSCMLLGDHFAKNGRVNEAAEQLMIAQREYIELGLGSLAEATEGKRQSSAMAI